MKKSRLGKGLDALIPKQTIENRSDEGGAIEIFIENIVPNSLQPRKSFEHTALNELAASIKEKGILQPLTVRKRDKKYEIIAGERRWRAAKIAGKNKIPVIIVDADDNEALQLALIENLQREDLNPIEEAEGYQALIEKHNLTHEEISNKLGKDRSTITNQLRLLKLSDKVKKALVEGVISAGHARPLLSLNDQSIVNQLLNTIIIKGLSVRQSENLVKNYNKAKTKQGKPSKKGLDDRFIYDIAEDLKKRLRTKVSIKPHGKGGKIEIEYYSSEELDRLIGILKSGR